MINDKVMFKNPNIPKKLILLGNGFDLHNNYKSSYYDLKLLIEKEINENEYNLFLEDKPIPYPRQSEKKYSEYLSLEIQKGYETFDFHFTVLVNFPKDNKFKNKIYLSMYYILFSYYAFIENKNEEYINWGDIEGYLRKIYIDYPDVEGLVEGFEYLKYFISNVFIPKARTENTEIEEWFDDFEAPNDIACVNFNYTDQLKKGLNNQQYFNFHGSQNGDIIFGTNMPLSDSIDPLKLCYDKKIQKMHQSSLIENYKDLNISEVQEVICMGFGFSVNDDYFIHALLHNNPNIKFIVVALSEEITETYANNQLQNLFRSLSVYEHDKKLLEKKIVNNDFKIKSKHNVKQEIFVNLSIK